VEARDAGAIERTRDHVVELTGIAPADFDTTIDEMNIQVRELADAFHVDLGDEVSYESLREHAVEELVALTVSAEKERECDSLTGLLNHGAFVERAGRILQDAATRGQCLGLIFLDIDRFKDLNDRHGHQAGDVALQRLADCLRSFCGEHGGSFAARYGGEEFAIVLPEVSESDLSRSAEILRGQIARLHFEHQGARVSFTASLGITHARPTRKGAGALSSLVASADAALYEAKNAGRNCVRYGAPSAS
jgi:diguanylate cyclase (GGDEF)-like protein